MKGELNFITIILHEAIFGVSVFPHVHFGTRIVFSEESDLRGIEIFC